jgi:hypothetical protein
MADSILRLKVESQEYDNKLKRATEGLTRYIDGCRKIGGTLEQVEKETVEYVRSLGQMETTSRTATGRLNEMKKTFVDLSVQYKSLTDAEKSAPFGRGIAESLDQLKPRILDAKKELDDINKSLSGGGGGLLAGIGDKMSGALQVFAGNMLTKGVSMLTSELAGSVQESVELARQGEGIRIAFERIGRGDLLGELRQATHGTITDLELMKAAVRFDDFKLPLDQLGTMLAFAQQKAKDTGQSFDYMVDSIVTGLGRQSPKILDNLGLSITEIHQKTKETGDMTKAVGEIIREQMEKAGDYVETAADRAARATVDTKNRMEELGRSAMPVAEEFSTAWHEIRNGAMTIVMPVLKTLADSFRDIREILNGEWDMPTLKPGIQNLADGPANSNRPKKPTWGDVPVVTAPGGYVEVTDKSGNVLHGGHYDSDAQLQNMMKRWSTLKGATGRRGGSRGGFDLSKIAFDPNKAALSAMKGVDTGPSEIWKAITEGAKESTSSVEDLTKAFEKLNGVQGVTSGEGVKDSSEMAKSWSNAGTAISAVGSAMSQIEDPAAKVMATVAQAIATIALTYAKSLEGTFTPWDWIAGAASGLAMMINVISAIHSSTGYAQGGVIKGNSYSGDNIGGMVDGGAGGFVGLNAGEVVLNAAQQRGVASALSEGGNRRIEVFGRLSGETIFLSSDRYTRRTGRGTIMTWK